MYTITATTTATTITITTTIIIRVIIPWSSLSCRFADADAAADAVNVAFGVATQNSNTIFKCVSCVRPYSFMNICCITQKQKKQKKKTIKQQQKKSSKLSMKRSIKIVVVVLCLVVRIKRKTSMIDILVETQIE